jgi:pimeloyl-ACP methyl ester carboxylesterase
LKRPWRKLLLLSMVAALAGWWLAQRHVAAPAFAVNSAAPDVLQLGRLRLEPCSIGRTDMGVATARAYCTGFPVPEDRAHPDGRTIRLKVAIVPAEAAEAARDLVVFLDGGPGGAATADYPAIAAAFGPLRKRHALLLVDQRGTGGSNALECPPEPDEGETAAPDKSTPPRSAPDESAALARLRACLARLAPRAAPQFYATGDAVADLEDLRLALGGPQFDLVGVSYGTRVAQQYAKAHADAVRALVLDSAVPNDLALGGEHARNLEDALAALFRRCRSEAACADRYGDPYRTLRELQERLRARPVSLRLRDPYTFRPREQHVTADSLAQLVRIYAYNPHTAALLPYLLHGAAGGDYAPLMGQSQLVVDDVAGSLDDGMALSVLCTEDVDGLRVNPADEGTVLGNTLPRWLLAACAIWPRGARAPDFGEPLRGEVPALVLAGERDPVTPARYGREIVASLPRARLLQLAGQGHGVLVVGCVPHLVSEFIRKLDALKLDARCLDALGSAAPFLDANGAGP